MKNKLQVAGAAVDSVKFGLVNIPTIIRLGWIGFVLYLVIYAGGIAYYYGEAIAYMFVNGGIEEGAREFAELSDSLGWQLRSGALSLLGWLVVIPFIVMIRRVAAGETTPPPGIGYFRFGGRELKFAFSHFVLAVLSLIVVFVFFLPGLIALLVGLLQGVTPEMLMEAESNPDAIESVVESNAENGGAGFSALVAAILLIAGLIGIIWFAIRACLFTTVAAVENRLLPFDAFGLTGGNVWRIIGSAILLFLMIMALYLAFFLVMGLSIGLFALVGMMAGGGEPGVVFVITMTVAAILGVGAFIAFICAATGIEHAFPAKMYASITRGSTAGTPLETTGT